MHDRWTGPELDSLVGRAALTRREMLVTSLAVGFAAAARPVRADTVITTGHAFAETFIPELGAWAKVDVSLNKLFILNPDGRPLTSADVYLAINSGNITGLTARVCREGAALDEPYAGVNDNDSYYYSYGAHLVYKPGRSRVALEPDHYAALAHGWVTYPYKVAD